MAFGQQAGPPATARQVQQLRELLAAAGHDDFREARGPLGLTQRQAAGKFTRTEAEELIATLEAAAEVGASDGGAAVVAAAERPAVRQRAARKDPDLAKIPSEVLAGELQSRGWVVLEP